MDHAYNSQTINKVTTFLGVKVILSCSKQLPISFTSIFELFIHINFGQSLLFAVIGSLLFSFDNLLDFHSTIVSVRPAGTVEVSLIVWNIKKFCDPSSLKKLLLIKRLKSYLFNFPSLSCSASNSAFLVNVSIFWSKSELLINPKISDLLTESFLYLHQVFQLQIYYNEN